MSIRLIVEVLDHWQDFGLTAGERSDLIVVAENADGQTRETVGPLHEEYILQRAGKSAAGWKNALGKLMSKKALEYAIRNGREMKGHSGQYAVYRIPELCPDPPHHGYRGKCSRPERVTSEVTQPESKGHLTGDPIDEKGHLTGGEGSPDRWGRVTPEVTPTPVSPVAPQDSSPESHTFDDFWNAYPRKVAKGAARAAFAKAMKRGADPDRITQAAASHASAWKTKDTDPQYIPYPATWLNQERYDDAPEPATAPRSQQSAAYQPPVF
ncbi:hypothetical protein DF19_25140 [Streptomyces olindensis]|nr:hypothetical protein DF19_25140 [Streptomyces olindensis]